MPRSRISLSYFLAGIKADTRGRSRTDNNYLFDALRYVLVIQRNSFFALPPRISAFFSPPPPPAPECPIDGGFAATFRDSGSAWIDEEPHLLIAFPL